ncbi:alpha-1,4-glucan--maltose-1-phosphate maltosyltransferase [Xanthobacter sp. KR7-65]|uniref:alpha-1,4-glucan--maltose-1-phosphate maltosyltransferase n=1 Tax=Xanthobacter sp. KR7-65 TaxID=3156612 RepID=UPI0032B45600
MHRQAMDDAQAIVGRRPATARRDALRPRLYFVPAPLAALIAEEAPRIVDMGFDGVLLGWPFPVDEGSWFGTLSLDRFASATGVEGSAQAGLEQLARACEAAGLSFHMDLVVTEAGDGTLTAAMPDAWQAPPPTGIDPRRQPHTGRWRARPDAGEQDAFLAFWRSTLETWRGAGVAGLRCHDAAALPAEAWHAVLDGLGLATIGWMPGRSRDEVRARAGAFDFVTSSAAWWDARAPWLVEEYQALRPHARLMAFPEDPFGPRSTTPAGSDEEARHRRAAAIAAMVSDGWLMPMGFEFGRRTPFMDARQTPEDFRREREAARLDLFAEIVALNSLPGDLENLRQLSGPGAATTLILAKGAAGERLLAFNPDAENTAPLPAAEAAARLALAPRLPVADALPPGGAASIDLAPAKPVVLPRASEVPYGARPRVAIEAVTPSVDGGRFAVKRCVGDVVTVEADIFSDGHEKLAAELRFRAADEKTWSRVPMTPTVNDRWQASFPLKRVGRHEFVIEAWWDQFGTFRRDLGRKRDAGRPLGVELAEGRALLESVVEGAPKGARAVIRDHLRRLKGPDASQTEVLLSPPLASAMAEATPRGFATGAEQVFPVEADREGARFASWYELFPRSITDDSARHGTLRDVIGRLPAIRDMGFDVLYFPPIHPIGATHRKGRNNSLTAGPDDPGSPYAIGSADGGHEAIHPELGTLEDFRALVAAAKAHGLEIALDFAIQCSPDHPWLKQHPDWFQWRPDGTIRYAENPPKTYEDIVNVDFYAKGAVPGLWLALRDVVEGWVREGVRIFRVDNPHTKPFPFWEWLIADIRSRDPGVIFLAEAFTRPKVMYRLGKIGFSQSYTYFTWRNEKGELRDYLEELNRLPARDIYRPHFFVNTPDINPYFLQRSGRPGFLIRAALAATLSGLWGVYSGFELCEAEPVPGKEEYVDSEKYEIKPRNYFAAGNIIPEITKLNFIRRAHPALQTHLNVSFYTAYNDHILYFGKRLPEESEMVLVAVSLDPERAQSAAIEVPLWEFGLPDQGTVEVVDLVRDRRFTWTGKMQAIHLDPSELPYAIFRIRPAGAAS